MRSKGEILEELDDLIDKTKNTTKVNISELVPLIRAASSVVNK